MKSKQSSESGFSLIELLVVLLIISILVALALIGWYNIVDRARLTQQQSDIRDILIQLQNYRVEHSAYPDDSPPGISPEPSEIIFPKRENYLYDYDHFTVNCVEWVKVAAYPVGKPRLDPYLEPGIVGQWVRTGNNIAFTFNSRRVC